MFRTNQLLGRSSMMLLLASGVSMHAQTSGSLSGLVKGPKGPLSGVRVTISSPALFQPRVVMTDDKGEWRAPLLPVGNFSVTFSKQGYIGPSVTDIRLGIGAAVRQDVTLKEEKVAAAVVEVVETAATADKTDTKVSSNFSADTLAAIPSTNRSFEGAANLAPGLVTGSGGSYVIRGGKEASTGYSVNNTGVKDDYQGTRTAEFVIEDNIEDVQVMLSPLNARLGRTDGGSINVVTKSGGNDFKGSIRANIQRNSWNAKNPSGFDQANDTNMNRKYTYTVSGPIVKDRVWFAVGGFLIPPQQVPLTLPIFGSSVPHVTWGGPGSGVTSSSTNAANVFATAWNNGLGPGAGWHFTTFDTGTAYNRTDNEDFFEGKITAAATPDHTFEFTYSKDDWSATNRDPYSGGGAWARMAMFASSGKQSSITRVFGLNYKGVLSSTAFIEARYNTLMSDTSFPQGDLGFSDPVIVSIANGNSATLFPWRSGSYTHDLRNNQSGNINLKLFVDLAGNHEIDTGVDFYEADRGTARAYGPNNRVFITNSGVFANASDTDWRIPVINRTTSTAYGQSFSGRYGLSPTMTQYVGQDGHNKNRTKSLYLNDSWSINQHWNAMVGLRYDKMSIQDTDGVIKAKSDFLSPRLSVKYDLKGDSAHVFSATLARFATDFSTGFSSAFIKDARATYGYYGWYGNTLAGVGNDPARTNQVAPGSATDPLGLYGVRFVSYSQLVDPANYGAGATHDPYSFSTVSLAYRIDPNLKPSYSQEATVGYRRNYSDGSNVSLTYVMRTWHNEWAFISNYGPEQFTLANPVDFGMNLTPRWVSYQIVKNSDDLKRTYHGVELSWSSKINRIWNWGGNYTWSRLTGNTNGGDASGTTFRDNAAQSYYFNRAHLINNLGLTEKDFAPIGPLTNDQTHRVRAYLTADLPLGKGKITYSWLFQYDSGSKFSAANTAPLGITPIASLVDPVSGNTYPNAAATPTGYTQFYGGRGQYSSNDTYRVDFKLAFYVPLGVGGLQAFGDLTISNLFNHQIQAVWDNSVYTAASGVNQLYFADASVYGRAVVPDTNNHISARNVAASLGLRF